MFWDAFLSMPYVLFCGRSIFVVWCLNFFHTIFTYSYIPGLTICPTSEIVCLPVLIFTYSHVENALFFALDLFVFLQLEFLFQTYQLVYYPVHFFASIAKISFIIFVSYFV